VYALTPEEDWLILTNLGSLEETIAAYKKRFGIEEAMQRGQEAMTLIIFAF
jgi:hypothetical protein